MHQPADSNTIYGMETAFVISGLKNKRARIAGEIAQNQQLLDQRRAELAQTDAVTLVEL